MMKNRKTIAALLVAAMVTSVLAGCGEGNGDTSTQSAVQSSSPQSTTDTSSNSSSEPVKLTLGMQPADNFGNEHDDFYLSQKIQKDLNLDFDYFILPADKDGTRQKISMLIASGDDLPDVFALNSVLDEPAIYEYGSKGIFIDVEPYLLDEEKVPNFYKIPEDLRNYIIENSRSADGKIYSMPNWSGNTWNEAPYRMWVNQNWLESGNLEMPSTLDEFYEVLKYFNTHDMNGNGTQDEIPMVGEPTGWASDIFTFILNAYTYVNPDKSYLTVENGKVGVSYTRDEFREGLKFIRQLVSEGLISSLSFTQDTTQLRALVSYEGGIAGFVPNGTYSTFTTGGVLDDDDMILVPPFIGPEGEQNSAYNPSLPYKFYFITKACENVDAAVALGQYFYDETISIEMNRGEKGVDWDNDPETCKLYTNDYVGVVDGVEVTWYLINDLYGTNNTQIWGNSRFPRYFPEEASMGMGNKLLSDIAGKEVKQGLSTANATHYMTYKPCFPDEVIRTLNYLPEESDTVTILQTQLVSYVQEMMTQFVTGNASLENDWEAYLQKLEEMKLSEYLEIVQKVYDRQ